MLNDTDFKVAFLNRATLDLAGNESVARWEPSEAGTLRVFESELHFSGNWKLGFVKNYFSRGLIGQFLIKPFLLKKRDETIPFGAIENLVIWNKKKTHAYHVFRRRDDGTLELHVFAVHHDLAPLVTEALKAALPDGLVKEEVIESKGWFS